MLSQILATGTEHRWVVAPFFWALWLGVLAVGLVALLRGRRSCRPHGRSAEQILAERFARGEISSEEFRDRRDALR